MMAFMAVSWVFGAFTGCLSGLSGAVVPGCLPWCYTLLQHYCSVKPSHLDLAATRLRSLPEPRRRLIEAREGSIALWQAVGGRSPEKGLRGSRGRKPRARGARGAQARIPGSFSADRA